MKLPGVTIEEASKAFEKLGSALAQVPPINIKTIASIRLARLNSQHGFFKVFLYEYWYWFLKSIESVRE